ncbi:MAG TPA: hypothetical protein VK436_12145 [Methanocella sp.]|nr:hypothetical protein [Methanocella sp.]
MSVYSQSPEYRKIMFDENELKAIIRACEEMAAQDRASLDETTDADAEAYLSQVRKTNQTIAASDLVSFFKPGQEILIEREDLEPIHKVVLRYYDDSLEASGEALERALNKIGRVLHGPINEAGTLRPQTR